MNSAITLRLGRRFESAELYLRLPASQDEIDQKLTILDDYAEDLNKPIEIRDVDCEIVGIKQYLRMADLSRDGEMEKLNALAGKIEGMDERQRNMLWGALDSESVNSLDNVMRISDRLGDYVILPNITSDTDLGRFLVDTGYKNFPEAVRPYLDYRAIGEEYCAEHGGAYSPGGYVRRKSSAEQSAENRPALITLYLRTTEANRIMGGPYQLRFPATEEELDRAKAEIGIDDFPEAAIEKIKFGKPWMENLLPLTCFCVEDANELALGIEEIQQKDGELMKYMSVLSVMEPQTLTDALRLAMELDDYEQVTENAYEYGEQVLRRMGVDDEIIGAIDGYMDFEQFGEDSMVEDGVRRTEFGLIRRCSRPFPEEAQGQQMGGM